MRSITLRAALVVLASFVLSISASAQTQVHNDGPVPDQSFFRVPRGTPVFVHPSIVVTVAENLQRYSTEHGTKEYACLYGTATDSLKITDGATLWLDSTQAVMLTANDIFLDACSGKYYRNAPIMGTDSIERMISVDSLEGFSDGQLTLSDDDGKSVKLAALGVFFTGPATDEIMAAMRVWEAKYKRVSFFIGATAQENGAFVLSYYYAPVYGQLGYICLTSGDPRAPAGCEQE